MSPCEALWTSTGVILTAVVLATIAVAYADTIAKSIAEWFRKLGSKIRVPSMVITIPGIAIPAAIALFLTIYSHMSIDHDCHAQISKPTTSVVALSEK